MRLWIRYSVSDLLMTEARPISTTDRIAAQKKGMWLISAPTTDVTSDIRKGDRNWAMYIDADRRGMTVDTASFPAL